MQKRFIFVLLQFKDIALDSVWKSLIIEANDSTMNYFLMEKGRFRFIEKKAWCYLPMYANQDLPKEILIDVFEKEAQKKRLFLASLRFHLVDSSDASKAGTKY